MENSIVNQMPQQQYLPQPPAGASIVGDSGVSQMQQPQMQQQPIVQQQAAAPSPSEFFGSINWLEVAVYTAAVTFFIVGISHYRNQNRIINEEVKNQSDRITALETEMIDLVTPQQQ